MDIFYAKAWFLYSHLSVSFFPEYLSKSRKNLAKKFIKLWFKLNHYCQTLYKATNRSNNNDIQLPSQAIYTQKIYLYIYLRMAFKSALEINHTSQKAYVTLC